MLYRGEHLVLPTQRRRFQRLVLTLPIVLCAYLFLSGESGIFQLLHREQEIGALRHEIASIKKENSRLKEEVGLLQNDLTAIEQIARERYGMVKPNESVYMVYPHPPEKNLNSSP